MADTFGGGMIALVPDEDSVDRLAVDGGEVPDEMHLTLTYLGSDEEQIDNAKRAAIVAAAERVAAKTPPVAARVFGHATFNPDGHEDRDPCAVYLVGETGAFDELKADLDRYASAEQHEPYYPHVTGGYGLAAADLSYTGPVRFDALRVAMGEANVIIPLTGGEEEESSDEPDEPAGDDADGDDGD